MSKRIKSRGGTAPAYTGNRGAAFEFAIEHSNNVYEHLGLALVKKRPTPVKILGTTAGGKVHGHLEKRSTVDYDGTLPGGKAIFFEAKECALPERFPLDSLAEHQYEHLAAAHRLGAVSFLLIEFTARRTVYLVPFKTLERYWHRWKTDGSRGTASIPRDELDVYGYVVEEGRVPIDYLPVVRRVWGLEA